LWTVLLGLPSCHPSPAFGGEPSDTVVFAVGRDSGDISQRRLHRYSRRYSAVLVYIRPVILPGVGAATCSRRPLPWVLSALCRASIVGYRESSFEFGNRRGTSGRFLRVGAAAPIVIIGRRDAGPLIDIS